MMYLFYETHSAYCGPLHASLIEPPVASFVDLKICDSTAHFNKWEMAV